MTLAIDTSKEPLEGWQWLVLALVIGAALVGVSVLMGKPLDGRDLVYDFGKNVLSFVVVTILILGTLRKWASRPTELQTRLESVYAGLVELNRGMAEANRKSQQALVDVQLGAIKADLDILSGSLSRFDERMTEEVEHVKRAVDKDYAKIAEALDRLEREEAPGE